MRADFVKRIIRADKEQLVARLPFLARAIYELSPGMWDEDAYGTDGGSFFFSEEN